MRRATLHFARFLTFYAQNRPAVSPSAFLFRLSTQAQPHDETTSGSTAAWDEAYRARADEALFSGKKVGWSRRERDEVKKELKRERGRRLTRALLEASVMQPDETEEDMEDEGRAVAVEDQRSLSVGVLGPPNAGKSSLTNYMIGKKVAGVSRKTNTTNHHVFGMMTKGNTQISMIDTPGITLGVDGHPQKTDVRARVESAWKSMDFYDLLIVMFDVHRHLTMRPDPRVVKLIKYLGEKAHDKQKRVLCMNKVDLVGDKKELLKVAEEFKDLPGYDRHFMISGLRGSGVKDLFHYLMDQAVERPWEEEADMLNGLSEEHMKATSLEVVREKMLNYIHQEIPYVLEHRLMDWKELRDGSLRIEQHFIAQKPSQRQILVGKNGSMIGRIGVEANEELRSLFKRQVHLFLQVRVARKHGA